MNSFHIHIKGWLVLLGTITLFYATALACQVDRPVNQYREYLQHWQPHWQGGVDEFL